jgi:hypothetical protein
MGGRTRFGVLTFTLALLWGAVGPVLCACGAVAQAESPKGHCASSAPLPLVRAAGETCACPCMAAADRGPAELRSERPHREAASLAVLGAGSPPRVGTMADPAPRARAGGAATPSPPLVLRI